LIVSRSFAATDMSCCASATRRSYWPGELKSAVDAFVAAFAISVASWCRCCS